MIGLNELGVAAILIVLAICIEKWRLRHAGPNLVIREFRADPSAAPGEYLYIAGRSSGLIAWILTLFGLHAQTSFSATDDEIARETVGPSGFESLYAPLSQITCSRCAYYRAFWLLALSLGFFLFGLIRFFRAFQLNDDYARQRGMLEANMTLWACLAVGGLCYLAYALSKRILITVIAAGGASLGISCKRSVFENISVELGRAIEAVDLMNSRILAKRRDA